MKDPERLTREAAALRANLLKRKQQQRQRSMATSSDDAQDQSGERAADATATSLAAAGRVKIGILECGVPPAVLIPHHGTFADMVKRLLGPHADTTVFDVTRHELPRDEAAFDAYVLTGSRAGVYDDLPWIPPLLQFLAAAKGRTKLIGICFGHQAMAAAFGGKVVKSPNGWSLGVQHYTTQHRAPWMEPVAAVDVPAMHQDQVVEAPEGARVTFASASTPFAGLDYGDAISFQFHPEFDAAFGVALITHLREGFGALAGPAIASFQRPGDQALVGQWIGRFLTGRA